MSNFSWLLRPFSSLYGMITFLRNRIYDKNLRPSVSFDLPVICIGNIEVGGTGKTPMVDYLINNLSKKYNLAMLSRGYKRKTSGLRIAGEDDNASTLGDEPYLIYRKWKDKCTVAVDKSRETAIPFLLAEEPETQVILLDDAFQYRTVKPSLSIVLSRYERPFFKDKMLPEGRLREYPSEIKRAQILIFTKCPKGLSTSEREKMREQASNWFNGPIFFTEVDYEQPLAMNTFGGNSNFEINSNKMSFYLVSGIAHAEKFENDFKLSHQVLGHRQYPDHKRYLEQDIRECIAQAKEKGAQAILMTEKDAVKWMEFQDILEECNLPVFYWPLRVKFLDSEDGFSEILDKSITDHLRSSTIQ